jgi:hypothetical protein
MAKHIRTKHVTLKTYPNRHMAELDKALLEAKDIHVLIQGDDLSGFAPGRNARSGIRLLVPKDQAEKALKIIKKAIKPKPAKKAAPKDSGEEKSEK